MARLRDQYCNEHGVLNKGKLFLFGEAIEEKPERETTGMVGRRFS